MFRKEEYENYIKDKDLSNNICPICNKQYTKNGIKNHIKYHFGFENINKDKETWNKGLTKETDERVKKNGETLHNKIKNGEIIASWLGRHHSIKTKDILCKKALENIKNGKVTIYQNRWKRKPSYSESFTMKIIENDLVDKNYKREFPFHRFSFDFCWGHLKKYIEIDGEQHTTDEKQKLNDIEKDRLAKEEGWTCLRIYWQDLFNNTQEIINMIKNFIDEDNLDIEYANQRYKDYVKQKEIEKLQKGTRERPSIKKAEEIAYKVNKLIDSNIDFTKRGCIKIVSKIVGISENKGRKWIECWCPWLLENSYKRNSSVV